ncbi:hypothetical protein CBL_07422 [Carabus blaptoides fortunei]
MTASVYTGHQAVVKFVFQQTIAVHGRTTVNITRHRLLNVFVLYLQLLPLVGIVAAGAAALGVYALYFCNTRNDVQFRKAGTYDSMDLQKPPVLKMVATKDYKEYRPLTELENLYKDMAEAEELQKAQNK